MKKQKSALFKIRFLKTYKIKQYLFFLFLSWNAAWATTPEDGLFAPIHKHPANSLDLSESLSLTYTNITQNFQKTSSHPHSRMESIDFSHSKLSLETLRTLPKTIVELSLNSIEYPTDHPNFTADLIDAVLEFSNLKKLHLAENAIMDAEVIKITKTLPLTELDLSGNLISNPGAQAIAQIQSIVCLNLSNNLVGDSGAQAIAQMKELVDLDLSRNLIGDTGVQNFPQRKKILHLNLSDNQIGDDGAEHLAKMQGLASLDLSRNLIRTDGMRSFSQTKITDLNLSDNLIEENNTQPLFPM
jgi:Ran GTPase-activating protein (RanGAP) involved in mRNA processing and transport